MPFHAGDIWAASFGRVPRDAMDRWTFHAEDIWVASFDCVPRDAMDGCFTLGTFG
ncbi:MAG: hypothetical protein LBB47_08125 [Spirochaetaceae bacterium]|nr:hypothetical protein [Spirochaetaceae bacterium]